MNGWPLIKISFDMSLIIPSPVQKSMSGFPKKLLETILNFLKFPQNSSFWSLYINTNTQKSNCIPTNSNYIHVHILFTLLLKNVKLINIIHSFLFHIIRP